VLCAALVPIGYLTNHQRLTIVCCAVGAVQVISIESALKSADVNRPDLAALLRGVQDQERTKLKLTLSWYVSL
jgi:hypothetical protein